MKFLNIRNFFLNCFAIVMSLSFTYTNNKWQEITITPKPFQRIQNLAPGTRVILAPGIHGMIVFKDCKGTKDNPIVITNASTGKVEVNVQYHKDRGRPDLKASWRFIECAFVHIEGDNNPNKFLGIDFIGMAVQTHDWTNSLLITNCKFVGGPRTANGSGVSNISIKVPWKTVGRHDSTRYMQFEQEYAIVRNCYLDGPTSEGLYIENTAGVYHPTNYVEITNVFVKNSVREAAQVSNARSLNVSYVTFINSGQPDPGQAPAQRNGFQVGNASGVIENFVIVSPYQNAIIGFTKGVKIQNGAIYNTSQSGVFLGRVSNRYAIPYYQEVPVEVSNIYVKNGAKALVELRSENVAVDLHDNFVSGSFPAFLIAKGINPFTTNVHYTQNYAQIPDYVEGIQNPFFQDKGYQGAALGINPTSPATNKITIYPNPVGNVLKLKTKNITGKQTKTHYTIKNSKREVVRSGIVQAQRSISLVDLPKGLYYLMLEEDNQPLIVKRFIKK